MYVEIEQETQMLSLEPMKVKECSQALLVVSPSVLDGNQWAEAKGIKTTFP